MTGTEAIDKELVEIFEGRDEAAERLAALGPNAFDRVFELATSPTARLPVRLAELIAEPRRASADCWTVAITAVARADPARYVDRLGTPTTRDLSILAGLDDPRVVDILLRAQRHDEWLVRYHATRSLAARAEPRAYAGVLTALDDPDPSVRLVACAALGRRDPKAAVARYEHELRDLTLSPLLRVQTKAQLAMLRAAIPPAERR